MLPHWNRYLPRSGRRPIGGGVDTEVFGFVEHVRIGDGHRSQLGLPDGPPAELVVAEVRPGRRTPERERSHQVMLKVADAAKLVESAPGQAPAELKKPRMSAASSSGTSIAGK